jgi:putative ABC transport system ATP-binding protein
VANLIPPSSTSERRERRAILATLERLALLIGVHHDPVRSEEALMQTERYHAGSLRDTWHKRLRETAILLGIQLSPIVSSIKQAISTVTPDEPLTIFIGETGHEPSRWLILTDAHSGRVKVIEPLESEEGQWLTREEFLRLLQAHSEEDKLTWLLASSTTPLTMVPITSTFTPDAVHPTTPSPNGHHEPAHAGHQPHGGHGHGHSPDHHHRPPAPLRRLIAVLWPEKGDLFLVLVFALFMGLLSLAIPIAVEALVTTISQSILTQPLILLAVILFGTLTFSATMQVAQTYLIEYMQQRLYVRATSDFAYRLPRMRNDNFDNEYAPESVNRFLEIMTMQKTLGTLSLEALGVIVQAIIGMIVLAFYHPLLLGLDLFLIVGLIFMGVVLGRGAVRTGLEESRMKYATLAWLEEVARNPKLFKSEESAIYAQERAETLARDYLIARNKQFNIVLRQIVAALALYVVASSILLGLGGWLVINRQLTLGQLVAAELIVTIVVGSFTKLGKYLEALYDLQVAAEKLGHITDMPLEREGGEAVRRQGGMKIKLMDLSFTYPGAHVPIFDGVHEYIGAGEKVAITGPSGSGKTTLIELLLGYREPTGGTVEIDDVDLRNLRLDWLRSQVAVVSQVEVFEGTIAENLRMGRSGLTIDAMRNALARVNLLEEILTLPRGLQSRLTSEGRPLSRGQLSRLMIARAILGNPRMIVLDGVLDGIRVDQKQELCETLFQKQSPWTLLVITSNRDVVMMCDREIKLSRIDFGVSTVIHDLPAHKFLQHNHQEAN